MTLPTVRGAQHRAPGAQGVTSYGLFSRVQPPAHGGNMNDGTGASIAVPGTGVGIANPAAGPVGSPRPRPGFGIRPGVANHVGPKPTSPVGPMVPPGIGANIGTIAKPQMPAIQVQPQLGGIRPQGPQMALTKPPVPSGAIQPLSMAQRSTAPPAMPQQQQAPPTGQMTTQALTQVPQEYAGAPDATYGDGAAEGHDPNGTISGSVGEFLGNEFSYFVDAWNEATGGGSTKSFEEFLSGMLPGFEQSSLMGDVGQNMTSMMDPAAWEQMAANRLASANEANLAGLNTAERRMNDRAARSGLANTGGVMGQMYNDFAGRGIQAERDIFNDTLSNQMNAIGHAGQFALGSQQQDLSRWNTLAGLAGMGAAADYQANREDNPSGAAVLEDILGAIGGIAGGAQQGGQSILSMLPMLLAL